jgi:hypothetical protein
VFNSSSENYQIVDIKRRRIIAKASVNKLLLSGKNFGGNFEGLGARELSAS